MLIDWNWSYKPFSEGIEHVSSVKVEFSVRTSPKSVEVASELNESSVKHFEEIKWGF